MYKLIETAKNEKKNANVSNTTNPSNARLFHSTVVLVYSAANPSPETPIRTAANLVYTENASDTVAEKLEGSLLNAAVFVVLVAAVTFLILVFYYYKFTGCLTNYIRFSSLGANLFPQPER